MDDADKASDHIDATERQIIAAERAKAARMPVGDPGECEYCGEHFARLVNRACGRCRDEYKLI